MDLSSQLWFHGLIDRCTAEKRLIESPSVVNGIFLVRSATNGAVDTFSLSVFCEGDVYHYMIEKKEDERVWIQGGRVFQNISSLIEHYKGDIEFLATNLTLPCLRRVDDSVEIYHNITYRDLEDATRYSLRKEGITDERAVGSFKHLFLDVIGNKLHEEQPWFHNITSSKDGEDRLEKCGCSDGMFLIKRSGSRPGFHSLILCHNKKYHHYLIERNSKGELYIQGGRVFPNLMGLVSYHTRSADGLEVRCTIPCDRNQFEFGIANHRTNVLLNEAIQKEMTKTLKKYDLTEFMDTQNCEPSIGHGYLRPVDSNDYVYESLAEGNNDTSNNMQVALYSTPSIGVGKIDPSRLKLKKTLGVGFFGCVKEATYKHNDGELQTVAVKLLRKEMPNSKAEFKKEADIMAKLKHEHIVQLIGISESKDHSNLLLVMELAPLGNLSNYLQKNPSLKCTDILTLVIQVCKAMAYLESREFVHRDLAARNVLLKTNLCAKVSDFGLSRATGIGKNYYLCEKSKDAPRPICWHAPECLAYDKFSYKTDVWSFGVMCWEAFSHGMYPNYGVKQDGTILLKHLKQGNVLAKPAGCPGRIYKVMTSCWQYNSDNRPSFKQIETALMDPDNLEFEI